jgi:iron complex outermembrane receptor protein
VSSGVDVSDNRIPFTPDFTATVGAQVTHALTQAISLVGRAEAVFSGAFEYDEANTEGQEAYSLVNLRAGTRWKYLLADVWLRNAFDTRYIPIAIPYSGFAPSGFIGENGRPRTFGVSFGVTF